MSVDEHVDGAVFKSLTSEDLSQMGIKMGPKKKLLALIKQVNATTIEGTLNNNTTVAAGDPETANQATSIIKIHQNCERVVCFQVFISGSIFF
jgi:hypothetical protein